MRTPSSFFLIAAAVGVFSAHPLHATISTTLTSSLPAPQLVGAPIVWTAVATDSNPNPITYRFEIAAAPFTTFRLLQDFSVTNTFTWVETYVEGQYVMRVTARDYLSGESTQVTSQPYQINSRVTGRLAVVSTTPNPLVALFSAPTCVAGAQMQVFFKRSGTQVVSYTDWRACHAGSMNFYVAGLAANSTYNMNYQVMNNGKIVPSPQQLPFTTGSIPTSLGLPTPQILVPATSVTDQPYKISLSAYAQPLPFAANLQGEIIWYAPSAGQLVRTLGQTMLMNTSGPGTYTGPFGKQTRQQLLREYDLAGNIIRQTNADRIAEQLVALGTDPVARFNHDAIRLSNGHTLALCDAQRAFPAGTQGSAGPIDIIGELIVELDENFQVVYFWNAFDHDGGGSQLDINRAAIGGEKCIIQPNGITPIGCPPGLLPGFKSAADWLHANCVQLLSDGNLLLSLRDQDWIIKINYQNGAVQNGAILWRMGHDGDFTINSGDSYPWFSAQHEPDFYNPTEFTVFDNGNTRVTQNKGGNSRGMAFSVDEANMIVTTLLSADLGVFANSQGSAQILPNGNYHFQPGIISNTYMESLEVTPTVPNPIVFNMKVQEESYRTFRMPDMYTPPYGTASSTVTW